MYIPTHFAETDIDVLQNYISKNPLGTLVTNGKTGLDANHIPFEFVADEEHVAKLRAHVARANPLWQESKNGDDVLVIFRSDDAYISPNWYPTKHESQRQVPTWNYRVVHAHGKIYFHDDEKFVRGVVARLTRINESSQPVPWKMSDAPTDYIDSLLKRIVGVEIEITRIEGKSKLGQDEVVRDVRGAGNALVESGKIEIGAAMLAHIQGKRD